LDLNRTPTCVAFATEGSIVMMFLAANMVTWPAIACIPGLPVEYNVAQTSRSNRTRFRVASTSAML
jgi:hypothetical protein